MLTLNNISYKNINISLTILSAGLLILDDDIFEFGSFLEIIAGLKKKENHKILWNNQKISEIYYAYSSDVNLITKKLSLDIELNVRQNLNFLSSLSETRVLINSAILYFELDDLLDQKIKNLSLEQTQRVKLSQLIFSPKTIWLLENPDQFLSQKWQEKLFNLISTRISDGGMVIMNSNNKIFEKIMITL